MPIIVGLISDTHGLLRPEVSHVFAGVDFIVHAGDVGGNGVLEALSRIARVVAVSGNVDDRTSPALPRERVVAVGSLSLHVSHGDELGRPNPDRLLATYSGDVIVYGHTHRALVVRSGARVVVNPGAAGPRRFDLKPSVARLSVENGRADVEIIELVQGRRIPVIR